MYLAIEGVIGVGKTTLARLLKPAFEGEVLLEVFEENPFLSNFYSDRSRYAFQTQIFFLMSRYHQQNKFIPGVLKTGKMVISDYTFDKDALFAGINLEGDELEVYHNVHSALADKIPNPDLVIYLKASLETLMNRIAHRDRSFERNMDPAYIGELMEAYDHFFAQDKWQGRVLNIETDDLNFIADPADLNFVINQIKQALRLAPYQQSLPLEN
ncbi:MAG: deoxynucleoside kinase [Anaerolineaceae bacterium]|jgi:deoxyguanosine kinase|nr:deoxynucleoside kinase [Anaerolineaceae bacterium]NLC29628.1 deoxynucleoside kinase [Chloroflexota bacterium]